MNNTLVLCLATAPLLLQGCGVTLQSKHVANSKPSTLVPGEGIVYALPKTELQVVQPVKVSVPTAGVLQEVFDDCKRACEAGATGAVEACAFSTRASASYSVPRLRAVAVADMSRLYQITPSADLFQSIDFKFDIASNGVLEQADNSATNLGYEVVASVATNVLKLAALAKPMASSALLAKLKASPSTPRAARSCYQVSTDVAQLAEERAGRLQCSLVDEIKTCLQGFDQAVDKEHAALDALFDAAKKDKTEAKLLTMLAVHHRERIEWAKTRRDEAAALYGLAEGHPKEATYEVVLPMKAPPEFDDHAFGLTLGPAVVSGTARILGTSDNAATLLPALLPALKSEQRHYWVTSTMPDDVTKSQQQEAEVLGNGYRYRVPLLAPTSLTVFKTADKTEIAVGPIVEHKLIAQYGPVASLPSHFKGKQGRVLVKHWPDSGGIQRVEIGAEGVPTSTVTGVLDEAVAQYKSRKEKAEAAAAVDSELNALKRQQELLSLKKQIKDLEEALKN